MSMIQESGTSIPGGVLGAPPLPTPYTQQDVDAANQVAEWLKSRSLSRSWLAKKARISSGTVSQVLNRKYPSSPTDYLAEMLAVIHVETERLGDGTPGYVEGSVHKLAAVVCDRTRKHANFGVLCGRVGVGKTRALVEYQKRRPQTLMVEANPKMTAGSLLGELLDQMGIAHPPGLDRKFNALVKAFGGTNYLIIADEAETLGATALHYLRRLRDKAGIGIVLSGTEQLHQLLKPQHGNFDQIRSRVSMWPPTIEGITRDDMDDMAREALAEAGEVADDVLDALWGYCDGSARVLMEGLVPALRDYGLGRVALSAALVHSIAAKVLFMTTPRGGK